MKVKVGSLVKYSPERIESDYWYDKPSGSIHFSPYKRQADKIPDQILISDKSEMRKSDHMSAYGGYTTPISGSSGIFWLTNIQPMPYENDMGVLLEERSFDKNSYYKIHWQKLNESTWIDIRDIANVIEPL